jgi:hypothetical protein
MGHAEGGGFAGRRRLPPLRRGLSRRALASAALALGVLVAGVFGYRAWQTSYYEGLFTRNHSTPGGPAQLYRDCMGGVDPAWLVSQDGGRTYVRTTFVGCEPVLAHGSPGAAMVALVPYA